MQSRDSARPVVSFDKLDVYRGPTHALKGVSGEVHQGNIIGIWGQNGSGKSTLLEILAGWREPQRGLVSWSQNHAKRPILIPADAKQILFPWYRVSENLMMYRKLGQLQETNSEDLHSWEDQVIAQLEVSAFLDRYPYQLSSGEQARIAITCGFLYLPSLLMLDETFTHIDWEGQAKLARFLCDELARRTNLSLILVSHAVNPVIHVAREVWKCESGTLQTGLDSQRFFLRLSSQMIDDHVDTRKMP